MSTVVQYKHTTTIPKSVNLVESDAKNALSTRLSALDLVGLTWVFKEDYD